MSTSASTSTLYERDGAVIAGVEKLRFFPLEVVSGAGSTLIAADGRALLDLSATWTASGLGHGHPAIVEAVTRSIQQPPGAGVLSAAHPDAVGLAEDLLDLVPGPPEIDACTSGTRVRTPTTSHYAPAATPPVGAPCSRSSTVTTAASTRSAASAERTEVAHV